ncbi:hypothetical protein CLOM_g20120 [Closterium sp. NIES-68]|nr:hypothetical protein CLOM_g20120 [Closterium sp. NIES-68]GJP77862.1 hypothetical protein CLOP_g8196 [Closterium sp. NIES-67]
MEWNGRESRGASVADSADSLAEWVARSCIADDCDDELQPLDLDMPDRRSRCPGFPYAIGLDRPPSPFLRDLPSLRGIHSDAAARDADESSSSGSGGSSSSGSECSSGSSSRSSSPPTYGARQCPTGGTSACSPGTAWSEERPSLVIVSSPSPAAERASILGAPSFHDAHHMRRDVEAWELPSTAAGKIPPLSPHQHCWQQHLPQPKPPPPLSPRHVHQGPVVLRRGYHVMAPPPPAVAASLMSPPPPRPCFPPAPGPVAAAQRVNMLQPPPLFPHASPTILVPEIPPPATNAPAPRQHVPRYYPHPAPPYGNSPRGHPGPFPMAGHVGNFHAGAGFLPSPPGQACLAAPCAAPRGLPSSPPAASRPGRGLVMIGHHGMGHEVLQGVACGTAQGTSHGAAQGTSTAQGTTQGAAHGAAQGAAHGAAQGAAHGTAQGAEQGPLMHGMVAHGTGVFHPRVAAAAPQHCMAAAVRFVMPQPANLICAAGQSGAAMYLPARLVHLFGLRADAHNNVLVGRPTPAAAAAAAGGGGGGGSGIAACCDASQDASARKEGCECDEAGALSGSEGARGRVGEGGKWRTSSGVADGALPGEWTY